VVVLAAIALRRTLGQAGAFAASSPGAPLLVLIGWWYWSDKDRIRERIAAFERSLPLIRFYPNPSRGVLMAAGAIWM